MNSGLDLGDLFENSSLASNLRRHHIVGLAPPASLAPSPPLPPVVFQSKLPIWWQADGGGRAGALLTGTGGWRRRPFVKRKLYETAADITIGNAHLKEFKKYDGIGPTNQLFRLKWNGKKRAFGHRIRSFAGPRDGTNELLTELIREEVEHSCRPDRLSGNSLAYFRTKSDGFLIRPGGKRLDQLEILKCDLSANSPQCQSVTLSRSFPHSLRQVCLPHSGHPLTGDVSGTRQLCTVIRSMYHIGVVRVDMVGNKP
eukprot:1000277_1